jgi:ubiquinone/menaquinone biosynthesis C-methylase UbiE
VAEPQEESRFDPIYAGKAEQYHQLVSREDVDGTLPAALWDIADFAGKAVVELGAGTGRVTRIVAARAGRVLAFDRSPHMLERARAALAAELGRNVSLSVADNRAIPLPPAAADIVLEGWSFGYTVNRSQDGWRSAAEALLGEVARLLKPGGTAILIETLGTGHRTPVSFGGSLGSFYGWLEGERGFAHRWIRTDYLFETVRKARELVEFFFGSMVDHDVLPSGQVRVPECTGLWWKKG